MEEVRRIVKKNSRYIEFFLFNSILLLLFFILIHITGLIDLNILIRFRHLMFVLLSLISIYVLFRYERSSTKEVYRKVLRGLFMGILVLQALSVNGISISLPSIGSSVIVFNEYSVHINFLFVVFSLLLLITHKKEIEEKEVKDISNRWAYVILVGILILFTWIKAPYFEYNFSGEHSMKYNSYVEPAKYMAEKDDFTWYQLRYLANPVQNPEGIFRKLPDLPLLEWTLASTFKLFPQNSIEFNTRLVTHSVGLVVLIFAFLLIREWGNNLYALITVGLMATNKIFSFASYVTVLDGMSFAFLLISLYTLTRYIKDHKGISKLFLAGIITGLGMSIKISFLILIIPSSLILILSSKNKLPQKIFDLIFFFLFTGILFFATRISIPYLGQNLSGSLIKLILGIFFLLVFYFSTKKFENKIIQIFEKLHRRKVLLPSIIILSFLIGIFALKFLATDNLINTYLTDSRFLLNGYFYLYMLERHFIPSVTVTISLLSMLGILSFFIIQKNKFSKINMIFLFTALFFWIIASKSIFPHSYYTQPIVISFLLLASVPIYYFIQFFNTNRNKLLILVALIIILLPKSIENTRIILGRRTYQYDEIIQFMKENLSDGDFYIDDAYLLTPIFDLDIYRATSGNILYEEKVRKQVRELGLKTTMEKYKIKLLITTNNPVNYAGYTKLFTTDTITKSIFDRGAQIEKIIYAETAETEPETIMRGLEIRDKFVFEKQIGEYRFFTFAD